MDETNAQDDLAVMGMVELFLAQVHHELPLIMNVVLQSDDAGCYSGRQLLVAIPFLNRLFPGGHRFLDSFTQKPRTARASLMHILRREATVRRRRASLQPRMTFGHLLSSLTPCCSRGNSKFFRVACEPEQQSLRGTTKASGKLANSLKTELGKKGIKRVNDTFFKKEKPLEELIWLLVLQTTSFPGFLSFIWVKEFSGFPAFKVTLDYRRCEATTEQSTEAEMNAALAKAENENTMDVADS